MASAEASASGDQGPRELRPQMLGGDWDLAACDFLGAYAWLNDVEGGNAQAIELRRHVAEGCGRVAIRH